MRLTELFLITLALSAFHTVTLAQIQTPQRHIDPYQAPDPNKDVPLEGKALEDLFMDRTHRGYYEVGDWDKSDPAFTEVMNADGTTVHDRDGVRSLGQWQTRANVVCFTYEDLNGGCFNIYQRGNCYYAMSAISRDLVAISVLDGETPDCEPSYA